MKYAQRVHYANYADDGQYKILVGFLEEHRSLIDEITLFTEDFHHGYHPLDKFQNVCDILKTRISDLKSKGFKNVGVNMLDTIGHIDEGYTIFDKSPFQHITDPYGNVSESCICPNAPGFKEYITKKYIMLAKADPDFIWVDDDIKIFYNGVKFGCFCDNCLAEFNRLNGYDFTREQLAKALCDPSQAQLRSKWVIWISELIGNLLGVIKDAVYSVNPDIKMGFMTQRQSWSTYHNCDFEMWFNKLNAVRGRPGEGFYFDDIPQNVYIKALETARQSEEYPSAVTDIQYEIEDFPYHKLQKSAVVVDTECKLAALQGINGILANTLRIENVSSHEDAGNITDRLEKSKSLLDRTCEYAKNGNTYGFYPAVSSRYDMRRPLRDSETFFSFYDGINNDIYPVYTLGMIGIPLTMNSTGAQGVILKGNLSDGYTDGELKEFLSRGVIMDTATLKLLWERGLGEYTGVKIDGEFFDGVCEKYASDPVNEGFEGELFDTRISFWNNTANSLKKVKDGVRTVCELVDYLDNVKGPCMTLYENELGGRVCVIGYSPFRSPASVSKRAQMQRIAEYLLKGSIPVKISDCCKACNVIRVCEDHILYGVTNLSLDILEDISLEIKDKKDCFMLTDDGEEKLECRHGEENKTQTRITRIYPFETKIFVIK